MSAGIAGAVDAYCQSYTLYFCFYLIFKCPQLVHGSFFLFSLLGNLRFLYVSHLSARLCSRWCQTFCDGVSILFLADLRGSRDVVVLPAESSSLWGSR